MLSPHPRRSFATYCYPGDTHNLLSYSQVEHRGSKEAVFLKKKDFQHKVLYGLSANAMLGGNYVRGVNR